MLQVLHKLHFYKLIATVLIMLLTHSLIHSELQFNPSLKIQASASAGCKRAVQLLLVFLSTDTPYCKILNVP